MCRCTLRHTAEIHLHALHAVNLLLNGLQHKKGLSMPSTISKIKDSAHASTVVREVAWVFKEKIKLACFCSVLCLHQSFPTNKTDLLLTVVVVNKIKHVIPHEVSCRGALNTKPHFISDPVADLHHLCMIEGRTQFHLSRSVLLQMFKTVPMSLYFQQQLGVQGCQETGFRKRASCVDAGNNNPLVITLFSQSNMLSQSSLQLQIVSQQALSA